jgi:Ca2+-transporting ATPase
MGGAALAGYFFAGPGPRASTITFHALTAVQLLHAFTSRSETRDILSELERPANPTLYKAIAASTALQMVPQAFPTTRRLLGLSQIGILDLFAIAGIALGSTLVNNLLGAILNRHAAPLLAPPRN